MNHILSAFLLLFVSLQVSGAVRITPKVEFQDSPQGLSVQVPRFSWSFSGGKPNLVQTAYRIRVAASERDLASGKRLCWDSGRVVSDDSHLVAYAGTALEPGKPYCWQATVWTADGDSLKSRPGSWSMPLPPGRDAGLQHIWIGLNDSAQIKVRDNRTVHPACYLRKEFTAGRRPARAMLYVSGIGSSTCHINGRRVSDDVFGPLPTWYPEAVNYITYDVTPLVRKGRNAIAVALGNGRYFPMRAEGLIAFGLPRLMARLVLEYSDGTTETVVSDTSWKATAQGPIRANNEYDGETYDASMELGRWTSPGYDDSAWLQAEAMPAPEGALRAQMSPSMKVMDTVRPVSVREVSPGRYIVDMGQNMVGMQRVTLSGRKGQPVTMRFAEVLKEGDAELYLDNLRSALVTDTYIPDRDGRFTWTPEFVYHGFRFMEITGVDRKPRVSDITGFVVYDDMASTGSFRCSDSIINRLHRNAWWGIRGNYRGMPTDCPQRDERHGWLGDRTTGAHGESFLFDNVLLYRKWLADIEDSMTPEGAISDVSPRYWTLHQDDVTWPAAYFRIADMLYTQFGDDYSIRHRYPSMKRWVDMMASRHLEDYIITTDTYGDWCMPPESLELIHSNDPARKTDGRLLSTATFHGILRLMAKFARMNGRDDDVDRFNTLADSVRNAFNARYFNPSTASYGNNTVTANLLALQMDVVPDGFRQAVADNAARRTVTECDGHVSVGVIGIQNLMRGLSDYGHQDLAFRIASNETYPSWGYMINRGATTIWELWNGDTADPAMNSRNHVMLLGDVLVWMYEDLAGIKNHPESAGFKKILMQPVFPEGLSFVEASHRSPYGLISSSWKRDGDRLEWTVTVPANCSAEVVLPARFNIATPDNADGLRSASSGDGLWRATVGSGTHTFRSR